MAQAPQIEMTPWAPTPPVPWKQQAGLPQEIAQERKFTHPAFNGGWQRDEDVDDRRMMIRRIVYLLRLTQPHLPQERQQELAWKANRMEQSLYKSAYSLQEYNDPSTLKQRLQQLAAHLGRRNKMMAQKQHQQGHPAQPQQQQHYMMISQPAPMSAPQQLHQAPLQQVAQQQRTLVNMADINPNMCHQQPQQVQTPHPAAPQQSPQSLQQVQYQQQPPAPAPAPLPQAAPQQTHLVGDHNGNKHAREASNHQQVLHHQQQRLVLLRHGVKCQHEDGRCPVTSHCAGMKRLWKHMVDCKKQECLVPHCVSSRYILTHYRRCKDVHCPVCGPVREGFIDRDGSRCKKRSDDGREMQYCSILDMISSLDYGRRAQQHEQQPQKQPRRYNSSDRWSPSSSCTTDKSP